MLGRQGHVKHRDDIANSGADLRQIHREVTSVLIIVHMIDFYDESAAFRDGIHRLDRRQYVLYATIELAMQTAVIALEMVQAKSEI